MDSQQLKGIPPVWLFSVINNCRLFFNKMYYRFVPPSMVVFEKSQGFWIAKAVGLACELNLAEIVGDEEKPVVEIAKESNTDPKALNRLMRALASEGIFTETRTGIFKNNKYSNALREQPGNLKNMIMHQLNETNWKVVNELKYSVKSGKNAAQKLLGTDIFTHLKNTPEKNELYNKAMSETSRLSSSAIVSAYSFNGINTLVDVGGGEGTLLCTILQKHAKIYGILFDLPHVVKTAEKTIERFDVQDRIQIIPGSFFEDPLPQADTYLLKNILHAFDDETSVNILKSIHKVIEDRGKVLLVEAVIRDDNKPAFGKLFDLQMLIGTENGRERSEAEFNFILEKAGFKLSRVVNTVSPFSIIEGIKI
jgi:DNA-binding Lrp family transcriptional regulator